MDLRVGQSVVAGGRRYRVAAIRRASSVRVEKYNPNHDERGRFASGGGGGTVTAFHGTSRQVADRIMKDGIKVRGSGRTFGGGQLYEGTRGRSVYVTSSQKAAFVYAQERVSMKGGGNPVVFKLEIPKDEWRKFQEDKEHSSYSSDAAYTTKSIPAKWIVDAWESHPKGEKPKMFKGGMVTAYLVIDANEFLDEVEKANPYHDERGRFTTAGGGGASDGGTPAYLAMVTGMQGPNARSTDKFIQEHGRAFKTDKETYIGGTPHECFKNTTLAVMADHDLTYVEGYISVHGVPIRHAWAIDKAGTVRDHTLRDGKGIKGYFGVPIQADYMMQSQLKAKIYGVLTRNQTERLAAADPAKVVAR